MSYLANSFVKFWELCRLVREESGVDHCFLLLKAFERRYGHSRTIEGVSEVGLVLNNTVSEASGIVMCRLTISRILHPACNISNLTRAKSFVHAFRCRMKDSDVIDFVVLVIESGCDAVACKCRCLRSDGDSDIFGEATSLSPFLM